MSASKKDCNREGDSKVPRFIVGELSAASLNPVNEIAVCLAVMITAGWKIECFLDRRLVVRGEQFDVFFFGSG